MCGIVGILGSDNPGLRNVAETMARSIRHRGPDAMRIRQYPGAVLGHNRLSIIDMSELALQPMESACGEYVIVFNGEIYNYKELRQELKGDYSFKSASDTEVLLAAWQKWGDKCLSRLNGMFAFCVYNKKSRSAFFARDRFGQKPIYLAQQDGALYFSSEIKAILSTGFKARENRSTWARYLCEAKYDDTRDTFFEGIWQLLPGEYAQYAPGKGISCHHYYQVKDHIEPSQLSQSAAAEKTRELIVESCRIHMRADVPVGMMLSGGLDSSTILSALSLGDRLNSSVKTFSVEFGKDLSERQWIEQSASYHHLNSEILAFSPKKFRNVMTPLMWHLEAPIGGLMNCALTEVMSAARKDGFVVLQGGAGADEIFGGYRNHHNQYIADLINSNDNDAQQAIEEYAANWGTTIPEARQAALTEMKRRSTAIDGTVPVRLDLLTDSIKSEFVYDVDERGTTSSNLLNSLIEYIQGSKIPRNLRMLDHLSMAYGLEVRLPFLDHRLVEHGLSLPPRYLFLGGRSKGIVREAFKEAMDDDVRLSTKRSIQAPQGIWLKTEPMKSYVDELISSESFASRGFFDVKKVKQAWHDFCHGEFDNSFFVWQWINVEEWFRVFVDADSMSHRQYLCPELIV